MSEEKFTPKTLAEFWANAPSEDAIPKYLTSEHEWVTLPGGPGLNSRINNWRWPPQEKVIDLSCLAGSDVLCAFWDDEDKPILFDKLHDFDGMYSQGLDLTGWNFCTPALGLWQACNGQVPDLPEGLNVTVRVISKLDADTGGKLREVPLCGAGDYCLSVAYRVNGKLDGYKWPWE